MMDCTACSQTPTPPVPVEIYNRPGLSAIAYRIGTFASFRAALFDAISATPELANLGTRQSDDYSITIMELWAVVADILTFYQERNANEGFLRTATQRDSLLRLVRLIDYQLQPGLAATAQLAFTLEKGASVTLPIGMRVQSVPQGDASPQKYETIESIRADARFNTLPILPAPATILPLMAGRTWEIFATDADMIAFAGTLAPGDRLIAYTPTSIELLTVAATVVQADRLLVQWVIPPSTDFTQAATGTSTTAGLFKVGRTFRLFGCDVKTPYLATVSTHDPHYPNGIMSQLTQPPALTLDPTNLYLDARYTGIKPGTSLLLATVATSGGALAVNYATVETVMDSYCSFGPMAGTTTNLSIETDFTKKDLFTATIYELVGPQLRLAPITFPKRLSSPDLYISGRRSGWNSIEVGRTLLRGSFQPGVILGIDDLTPGREVILTDALPTIAVSATVVAAALVGDQLSLGLANNDIDTITELGLTPEVAQPITALASLPFDPAPGADTLISFRNPQLQLQVSIGQYPPKIVSLAPALSPSGPALVSDVATALQAAIQAALPEAPEFARCSVLNSAGGNAATTAYLVVAPGVGRVQIAFAPTAADPDTIFDLQLDATQARYLDGTLSGPSAIAATRTASLLATPGIQPPTPIQFTLDPDPSTTIQNLTAAISTAFNLPDAPLIVPLPLTQNMLVLPPPSRFERPTFLNLTVAPEGPIDLDSASAALLGNVIRASQGETVANEIVGNGDASLAFQSFALRKKPVTFLPGDGPHNAESSLKVSVGGVLWQEVPTLYGAQPDDQVFVTRIQDDTTLTVQFGDGVTGARVPTGSANIVVRYRQGVGLAGRVDANSLTSLLDKPNGVKRATNPIAADGGANPQHLEDVRTNAPATVRTFGRAVSLEDFEDIVLATGLIAKASATWVWTGLQKTIFLTVAAAGGATLSPDGIRQLRASLLPHRDPNHRVDIANFIRVPITVSATLIVDPRYAASTVQSAAFSALSAALSFDGLQFGQAVHLSFLYGVLQNVPGIVAVDITLLDFKSQDPGFRQQHGVVAQQPQPHLFIFGAHPGIGAGGSVLPAELAWVEVPARDLILTTVGGSGA